MKISFDLLETLYMEFFEKKIPKDVLIFLIWHVHANKDELQRFKAPIEKNIELITANFFANVKVEKNFVT